MSIVLLRRSLLTSVAEAFLYPPDPPVFLIERIYVIPAGAGGLPPDTEPFAELRDDRELRHKERQRGS